MPSAATSGYSNSATANLGHAHAVSGLASTLDEPEFATAIGLVKYGALCQGKAVARVSWWARLKEFTKNIFRLLR